MKLKIVMFLLLVAVFTKSGSTQKISELNPKIIASDVETRFAACPRREMVTSFERKFHKSVWVKGAWGPPTNVFADIKANDSLLYPYLLVVEYNLAFSEGVEHKTKDEAQNDNDLSQQTLLPSAGVGKYRNTFLVNKDGLHLKTTEIQVTDFYGSPKGWQERPVWADACWDQLK